MTGTTTHQLTDEYLSLVERNRAETRGLHGDDYENQKTPPLLLQLVVKEVGVLSAATLDESNVDFHDAMVDAQEQCIVIGGLLASLYELIERYRIDYLDSLGELGGEL
jgi:hypothetical protein